MEKGCSCKTGCTSNRCSCWKKKENCKKDCLCKECNNIQQEQEQEQQDQQEQQTDCKKKKAKSKSQELQTESLKRKLPSPSQNVTITNKNNTRDVKTCLQDTLNILQNEVPRDTQEQIAQQSIIHSINSYLQLLQFYEDQSQILQKPIPKERKGVNADEIFDLTQELNQTPSSHWTEEQIQRAVHRLAEVSCFFMRGSPDARLALSEFHANWIDFASSRSDVKAMMDPEIIVFDVPWGMTPTWVSDSNRANACLTATAVNVPAPPEGYPVRGPAGGAAYIFTHPGPLHDVHQFARFMHGKNTAATAGYWRISTLAPPIYY